MDANELINSSLPLVTDYDDKYKKSAIEEVMDKSKSDPAAMYELANRYRLGEGGVERDALKSYELYKKVLQHQKNTYAMYWLGLMCVNGNLGEDKANESYPYFYAAYSLGDADSAVWLGIMYADGKVVEKDYDKALEYYQYAVAHGREDAYCCIGNVYRYKSQFAEAVQFYQKCLDTGHMDAATPLGWLYEDGLGVEKSDTKAAELYQMGYDAGEPWATFNLGRMYYLGKGIKEDAALAYKLLKEASDNGDRDANAFLGTMYGYGVNGVVEKDLALAFRYLDDVSETFQANAWYARGLILAKENCRDEALMWLNKAVEAGNTNAPRAIAQLNAPKRTLQQLAEEDHDPGAMIKYAMEMMEDTEQGGINKSVELIQQAHGIYPDNLQVTEFYVRIMFIYGHIGRKIGDYDEAYRTLGDVVRQIDILKRHNYKPEGIRQQEIDACMEYGELAYKRDEDQLAINMFARTDKVKYPYVSVMLILTYFKYGATYADQISGEVTNILKALNGSNWRQELERAAAYFVLSVVYATGVGSGIQVDTTYAYKCIQKCAEIDYEMAKDELPKYSKGFFGKITYRG